MTQEEIFKKNLDNKNVDKFVENFADKYLKNKSTILDLGCGTGRHSIFLANRGHEVYSLDKSKVAINKIKKLKNIHLYNQEILEMNFPNEYFDVIICIMVLHHDKVDKIIKHFKKIQSALKKGGLFCFSVLSSGDFRINSGREIEERTRLNIEETFDPEVPHHFFTEKEIKSLIKDYDILEMKQNSRKSAQGFKEFVHWDVIARLK